MLSHILLTFLLNSLWQVPLIACAAWLVSKMLTSGPASHRHTVWMSALALSVVLPLASIRQPAAFRSTAAPEDVLSPAPVSSRVIVRAAADSIPSQPDREPVQVSLARNTALGLLAAWCLFLAFRLAMLCVALFRTSRIRNESRSMEAPPAIQSVWSRAIAALGTSGAELRVSGTLQSPAMIGAWHRTVILPESLLNETSEDVLATAIGHELAHVARHDYTFNILAELLSLPIAFQPAVFLMLREIRRSRELACDELVAQRLMEPSVYANSIVTLARNMVGIPRPGHSLGVFDGNILEERVRRLLEYRPANLNRARWMLATGLSALAAFTVIASGLAISARAQSAAMPEMKLADAAFNSGDYRTAVEHLRSAVNLDPNDNNVRIHLANTMVRLIRTQQGNPPITLGDSVWEPVLLQYDEVLRRDPKSEAAIFGIANLGSLARWSRTHDLLTKLIADNPANPGAYYTIAVMDWQLAFKPIREASGGGMMTGQVPDPVARRALRDKYQTTIDEGIGMLQTGLQLLPGDSNMFAYMNLLYREAACLSDLPEQARDLLAKADGFVQEALEAIRANHGRPQPGMTDAPPPPPPPPPGFKPKR